MRGEAHVIPMAGSVMLFDELTPAEARILELVAQGLSTRQIASVKRVSSQAITYHIRHLLAKLDATNRAGLVAHAYAAKVLEPSDWPPRVDPRLIRDHRRSASLPVAASSVSRDSGSLATP